MIDSIKAGFAFGNSNLFEDDVPSAQIAIKGDESFPIDLHNVYVKSEVRLREGTHELMLTDRAVKLEVQPETTCALDFSCERGTRNRLFLKTLSLDFAKPLRIINILTTLDEVSILLSDRSALSQLQTDEEDENENSGLNAFAAKLKAGAAKAGDFLERRAADVKKTDSFKKAGDFWKEKAAPYLDRFTDTITDTKGWKKLTEVADKTSEKAVELTPVAREKSRELWNRVVEFSEKTLDKAIDGLSVTKIEFFSEGAGGSVSRQRLLLRFTGEVIVNDKVRIPMDSLQLPSFFLSRFDPELTKLLAQFCVTTEQGTSLSKTFIGMIAGLTGETDVDFLLSRVSFEMLSRGARAYLLDIVANNHCHAKARFELEHASSQLILSVVATFRNQNEESLKCKCSVNANDETLIACGAALDSPDWAISLLGHGEDALVTFTLEASSVMHPNALTVTTHDPRLIDDLTLPLKLAPTPIRGTVTLGLSAEQRTFFVHTVEFDIQGHVSWDNAIPLVFSTAHTQFPTCEGDFDLTLTKDAHERLCADLDIDMLFELQSAVQVTTIPEFNLNDKLMNVCTNGHVNAKLHAEMDTQSQDSLKAEFSPSAISLTLENFACKRDAFAIESGSPVSIDIDIERAAISADGIGQSVLSLSWKSANSPLLCVKTEKTPFLTDFSGSGHIKVHTSEQGLIHFSDGTGFYDERFFNALLYPEHEKEKLVALLFHKPLLSNLESIVRALASVTGPVPTQLVERIKTWYARVNAYGIPFNLKSASSTSTLSQMVSLFLFDRLDEADEIKSILDKIVLSQGYDLYKIMELLGRAFPNADITRYASLLRVVGTAVSVIPFSSPEVTHHEACSETEPRIALLPSANHLYDLDLTTLDERQALYKDHAPNLIDNAITRARIYKYAAGYTVAQLEWLLAHHADKFDADQRLKLKHLIDIKRRIHKQEPREGSFIVQDFNIDFFLQSLLDAEDKVLPYASDVSGIRDEYTADEESNELVECFATWVTPEDISRLLSAGIASRITSQLVQLNQARLLDYLVKRGTTFARATFYEAGAGSDRILASLLMSYLAEDQSLIKDPADRVEVLNKLLRLDIPRRAEHMPGGIHAAESYYKKIYDIAHQINGFTAYDAAKLRMQSERVSMQNALTDSGNAPKLPPHLERMPAEDDIAEIVRGLKKADSLGQKLVARLQADHPFDDDLARSAQKAYAYTYRVASAVLKKHPDAFQHNEFRKFYARTYESLLIQTLDRDLMDDIDQVRRWFEVRTGIAQSEVATLSRKARRNAIIDMIYYRDSDREVRRRDPLTWLDTRPAPGPIDLTILFAPGVITDGKAGHELSTAVERLKETYDIPFLRSDTGNIKSLAYNTEILANDIRRLHTPFMLFGYSQGCANMMSAEASLRASTPEDRATLNNLVARHFICSALNGSPHATAGVEVLRRVLMEAEVALKSFAAITSSQLTNLLFNLVRKALDAPFITMSLNSVESLSYAGLEKLARDAQFTPGVITTELQGVLTNYVPETLYYVLTHYQQQTISEALPNGMPNDSQVGIDSAHGYFAFNRNASVDLLRKEAMPSCTLNAHHWMPLYDEVAFCETPLDVQNAVYRAPKDIALFPAIEALILFGRIQRKTSS